MTSRSPSLITFRSSKAFMVYSLFNLIRYFLLIHRRSTCLNGYSLRKTSCPSLTLQRVRISHRRFCQGWEERMRTQVRNFPFPSFQILGLRSNSGLIRGSKGAIAMAYGRKLAYESGWRKNYEENVRVLGLAYERNLAYDRGQGKIQLTSILVRKRILAYGKLNSLGLRKRWFDTAQVSN